MLSSLWMATQGFRTVLDMDEDEAQFKLSFATTLVGLRAGHAIGSQTRQLEQDRARAGGVYMGMPGVPGTEQPDPVAKLAKAKAMLEQGLISEAEYEALKAKVLSEF